MIGEQDDSQEGSSAAAIKEVLQYNSEDSTAKGSTDDHPKEEKGEMICGGNAEVEKKADETIGEVNEVVESIAEAVFQVVREANFDQLGNRSSNTLGMRIKDSLILKVQQTQKKATPWFGGIRASQLVCQLRQISCEDDKDRFLRSPARIESPALSSESESLSTRQKKSVSLAEDVEVFNRLENEVFIDNEAGVAMGAPVTDDRENDAESEAKICGFIAEKSPPASVAESVSFVSIKRGEETLSEIPIAIATEDAEEIEEETSRRDFGRDNYSENDLPSFREMEIEKKKDFQLVESRSSSSSFSSCSEISFEMLQKNITAFISSELEDTKNLNTTSDDDFSLRLVNVEEKSKVEESSLEVDKSKRSLASEIAFSQYNSTSKINENFTPEVRETGLQLADEETDREKLFSEMLASIGCIVENLDNRIGLPTDKSKEDEISDGNKAESFLLPSKSSKNFMEEDLKTFPPNAVTAICDSTLLDLESHSEDRILETEVLIVDHVSGDELKNDDDDDDHRGVPLSDSPDQRFNSESLSKICDEINAEELSEEFEMRFEKCGIESGRVVVDEESSSCAKNAALVGDRDDKSAFKLSEKKFISAIVEGENLVKFASVSPGQKGEEVEESKNFIGKEAAVGRKAEMEVVEINDPDGEKNCDYKDRNDRDLDDDFSTENKDDSQSGSGSEILSRQKSAEVLASDKKLNMRIAPLEETNGGTTSWEKSFSTVSISRRKLSNESSDAEKDCKKLFESGGNSAVELSGTEKNGAITLDEDVSRAIETLLVIEKDKSLPNTIEEMESDEENKIRDEKCGEIDSWKVIRTQGEVGSKIEIQTIQDSGFSLRSKKSSSSLYKETRAKTYSKSTETCEEIEVEPLAVEDVKEEIRSRSRDRKATESAKKFANSLSRIFSRHSSRKSSQMEPQKDFEVAQIPHGSSDDREIDKKNASIGVEDNGEELVAVKSLGSINHMEKTTYHVFLAAVAPEDAKKNSSSEGEEAKEFFPNSAAAEGEKTDREERSENPLRQDDRPEKKRGKNSSGKSFAKIRKLFSKASTRSENGTKHRIQKQINSVKRDEDETAEEGNEMDKKQRTAPEATKQVPDYSKGHKNRSKVPFVNNSGAGVAAIGANEVETNYEQQVSRPESREDKRYKSSGVRRTNSESIDHLERVEMRASIEKDPSDESGAASTTASIEDGGKKRREKGVSETESVFSRTMKRMFGKRGSAADSIGSRLETRSILSKNKAADVVVESRKSWTKESFEDEGFAASTRGSIEREEIGASLINDRENRSRTSESKSAVFLLGSKTANKSVDALTRAFHSSSKRSARSSEDDMIESSSVVENTTRNVFSAAFMTEDNPRGEKLALTRDFDSIPFARRKSIVVMMATPNPPRREVPPEASSTSNHQEESSSSSPTAFYYLLGPTLDEALLDMKTVFQKLIDKIARRGGK